MIESYLADEQAMLAYGHKLAQQLLSGATIYLFGPLGAGKTTLVRGILRGLGYQGPVKSPTFTLVEPYQCADTKIYHFDLYRLTEPQELEYIGIRDYDSPDAICLIEWPEKGSGLLPLADITCYIDISLPGRQVRLRSETVVGDKIIDSMMA